MVKRYVSAGTILREEDVVKIERRVADLSLELPLRASEPLFDSGRRCLAAVTPAGHTALRVEDCAFDQFSDPGLLIEAVRHGLEYSEDPKRQVGFLLRGPDGTVLAKGVNTRKRGADGFLVRDHQFDHAEANGLAEYDAENRGDPVP